MVKGINVEKSRGVPLVHPLITLNNTTRRSAAFCWTPDAVLSLQCYYDVLSLLTSIDDIYIRVCVCVAPKFFMEIHPLCASLNSQIVKKVGWAVIQCDFLLSLTGVTTM